MTSPNGLVISQRHGAKECSDFLGFYLQPTKRQASLIDRAGPFTEQGTSA